MGESTEENIRKENGDIKKLDAVTQMHAAAVNGDKALLAKIIVCKCMECTLLSNMIPFSKVAWPDIHVASLYPLWVCMPIHFSKENNEIHTVQKCFQCRS